MMAFPAWLGAPFHASVPVCLPGPRREPGPRPSRPPEVRRADSGRRSRRRLAATPAHGAGVAGARAAVALHRPHGAGWSGGRCGDGAGPAGELLRGLRQRRRVEDREPRRQLRAADRQALQHRGGRCGGGPARPRHPVGGHRRAQCGALQLRRPRRLPEPRRWQDLRAQGPGRYRPHRPRAGRSARQPACLRGRGRQALFDRRRPRCLPDRGRRQQLEAGAQRRK